MLTGTSFDFVNQDGTFYKTLIDEVTSGSTKTTYIGRTLFLPTSSPLTSSATWSIQRIDEVTTGTDVDTTTFLPLSPTSGLVSMNLEFIWDNRAVLTYV